MASSTSYNSTSDGQTLYDTRVDAQSTNNQEKKEPHLATLPSWMNPPKVIKPPTKVLRTVEELVRLLNKVSDAYYEDKYPEFNDYEYNMLLAELKSVDPTHPYLRNY